MILSKRKKLTTTDEITWTNVENVLLSERSQIWKSTNYKITYIWNSRTGKTNIEWKISEQGLALWEKREGETGKRNGAL